MSILFAQVLASHEYTGDANRPDNAAGLSSRRNQRRRGQHANGRGGGCPSWWVPEVAPELAPSPKIPKVVIKWPAQPITHPEIQKHVKPVDVRDMLGRSEASKPGPATFLDLKERHCLAVSGDDNPIEHLTPRCCNLFLSYRITVLRTEKYDVRRIVRLPAQACGRRPSEARGGALQERVRIYTHRHKSYCSRDPRVRPRVSPSTRTAHSAERSTLFTPPSHLPSNNITTA